MLYETRRVLVGFRLHLSFDFTLSKDNSYIFVDVSKTPNIGTLLNNIVERFGLPRSCSLKVDNSQLLHSESINVLIDVDSVKVSTSNELDNLKHRSVSDANLCAVDAPILESESRNVQVTESADVSEVTDVVDGKSESFRKPKTPRRRPYEGVAATIKMLLEEEEINKIGKECSAMNISSSAPKIEDTKLDHVTRHTADETTASSAQFDEISDLNSGLFDCSGMSFDKKKRKRKRKHLKKREEDVPPSAFTDETLRESMPSSENTARQHIHFTDSDSESLNPLRTMETEDTVGGEGDAIRIEKCIDVEKPAENKNQKAPSTNVLLQERQNQEMIYERPKSSLSIHSGRVTKEKYARSNHFQANHENSVSSFITLPRLPAAQREENKSKCEQVEKELATLLMCKQLDTCMEFTVQFADEKGCGDAWSELQSPPKRTKNGLTSSSATCQPSANSFEHNLTAAFPNANSSTPIKADVEQDDDMQCTDNSDDCELLKQVKVVGQEIHFRGPQGMWTVLTEEIANTELPKLVTPKENQSIVFRVVYLNQVSCPTVSGLIYGRVVSYNAGNQKLALDIPREFIQSILSKCDGESLPESLLPITGTTYEVHLSALVQPKLIS